MMKNHNWIGQNRRIQNIYLFLFISAALSLIVYSSWFHRSYQDAWILEGLWIPLVLFTVLFLFITIFNNNLPIITVISSIYIFISTCTPSLKYLFSYGTTTDTAVHVSLVRHILITGRIDPSSVYSATPGFHTLVSILSDVSGISFEIWIIILPAILGCLIPLAFYTYHIYSNMPFDASKITIILSTICLPQLFLLNGTTFTVSLFVCIFILIIIREVIINKGINTLGLTLIILLLIFSFVVWHPSTSMVLSFSLIISGLFVQVTFRKNNQNGFKPQISYLGIIALIITLTYWMYSADMVWGYFIKNIQLSLHADITPDLIPVRLHEIPFIDKLLVGLFNHSRDFILIGLGIIGVFTLFYENKLKNQPEHFIYVIIWFVLSIIVISIFMIGFGSLGYKRFVFYVVAWSPPLAGYGLYSVINKLNIVFKLESIKYLLFSTTLVVFGFSIIQIYPYQPAMPVYASGFSQQSTPLSWMHQVNSIYQFRMIDFSANRIKDNQQKIIDYVGYQQSGIFFDRDIQKSLVRPLWQKLQPSYILLHWPGIAGPYAEQAEFRSTDVINNWRNKNGISTIYDNGGSFILFSPNYDVDPLHLEKSK